MNNPHQKLFEYCKKEKEVAMQLAADSNHAKTCYNAAQAVNAWDELMGQLYKNKTVTPAQFEKAKDLAIRIAKLMAKSGYKTETIHKILALEL